MKSLLQSFLREQGYALLEPRADGTFALLGEPPAWFTEIWGQPSSRGVLNLAEPSPFLENFLEDARTFWKAGHGEVCASGTWIEQTRERKDIPLEAVALRVDGEPLLSIHSPQRLFAEQSQVFQTARESMLAHERLFKEIQKKEILLHCIIHDLSQPLAAMRGCFDCLAAEDSSGRGKRFIDIGRQQTERQEALIREVLHTFADDLKEEMGTTSKPGGSADLLSCAKETVASFRPVFEAKGATIALSPRIDANADWRVVGDESRLRRIFSNLAENALRYAPRDSTVTIGLEEDGAYFRATVEDEGPGLPPGATPASIFALLAKGKEGGGKAGLGLYFCRITVERWGGTVGCESRAAVRGSGQAKGARFWFRLPKASGSAAVTLAAHRVGSGPPIKTAEKPRRRLRLLLADDQDDLRQVTAHLLEKEGHYVAQARNGLEALRALAKKKFDAVLLDDEMPEMSGSEAARAIRERESKEGGRQILLAVTGNTTEEDRRRLFGAGMDGCLNKPLQTEDLRQWLAGVSASQADGQPTAATPVPEKADLLNRVGGNARLLRQMVRTFRRDSLKKLTEMKRALARKDGMALATAAHALKGSAGLFGSATATENAQLLQDMGRKEDLAQARPVLRELDEAIAQLREELRGYDAVKGRKRQAKKRSTAKLRQDRKT